MVHSFFGMKDLKGEEQGCSSLSALILAHLDGIFLGNYTVNRTEIVVISRAEIVGGQRRIVILLDKTRRILLLLNLLSGYCNGLNFSWIFIAICYSCFHQNKFLPA